jgi:PAS domain S-box-containing protein
MYQSVVDNSLLGLSILQDEKFVFINQRTAEIFGYSSKEFQSISMQDIFALFHPEDQETLKVLSKGRSNEENVSVRARVRILTRSGDLKHVETVVKAIQYKGHPALHQTFFDITEYCSPRK